MDNVPSPSIKARWSEQETLLLAHMELELERRPSKFRFINVALRDLTAGRTIKSIKGKRKSSEYKALLDRLRTTASGKVATKGTVTETEAAVGECLMGTSKVTGTFKAKAADEAVETSLDAMAGTFVS